MSGKRAARTLLLHQGVVPQVNLTMSVGVQHRWDADQACFRPVLGPHGSTDIPGVAVAGDSAGIGGALVAATRGRIAGLAAVRDLAPGAARATDLVDAETTLARQNRGRRFLDLWFRPDATFRRATGDTIVCRCEEVTAAQIEGAVAHGCAGPNQAKAFLRCGMGPCQGRLCGLTVTEIIAHARGLSPDAVGHYRIRSPVRPITVGELAAMPRDAAAVQAVLRD